MLQYKAAFTQTTGLYWQLCCSVIFRIRNRIFTYILFHSKREKLANLSSKCPEILQSKEEIFWNSRKIFFNLKVCSSNLLHVRFAVLDDFVYICFESVSWNWTYMCITRSPTETLTCCDFRSIILKEIRRKRQLLYCILALVTFAEYYTCMSRLYSNTSDITTFFTKLQLKNSWISRVFHNKRFCLFFTDKCQELSDVVHGD